MKKIAKYSLGLLVILIAVNFLVMGLSWAVAPSGAAAALSMSLFNGAALSSQIGDLGGLFLGLGLFTLIGFVTRKREWFLATAILVYAIAIFRILAWLFHGASLVLQMILPEILIGTLLLIAARKLAVDENATAE